MATNKKELLANAKHWLGQAKAGGLGKYRIGAIFIFFDKDSSGSAVATANVDRSRLAQELQTVLKKMEDRTIIIAGDRENN
jgi:hypothetical protein